MYTPAHVVLRGTTVLINISFADGTTDTAGISSIVLTTTNPDGASTTYTWPAQGSLVAGTLTNGVVQFVTDPLTAIGEYYFDGEMSLARSSLSIQLDEATPVEHTELQHTFGRPGVLYLASFRFKSGVADISAE